MTHDFDLDPIYIKPDANGNVYQNQGYGSSMGYIDTSDPLKALQQAAEKNNQWSAEQASKQNEWQIAQNQKAMQFSAEQAALNRSWQEEMSNTAHQREVIDLQKAGLNPVLSATGGNGATVGSGANAAGVTSAGAKGDTDESLTMALMSYMAQQMAAQTSIMNTQTSANATLANAELMSSASRYAADLNYTLGMADMNHVAGGLVSGVLDPFSQGLSYVGETSAQNAAGKVKTWIGNLIGNLGKDTRKDPKEYGVSYKNSSGGTTQNNSGGSHSSGKFYESSGQVEKAVANARAILENVAETSGLNLWKAIDKATNGSLTEKAKNAKK